MKRSIIFLTCLWLLFVGAVPVRAALDETIPNRIRSYTSRPMELTLISEAQSASDLAGFYGFELSALEIMSLLPVSDDPTLGFVGDPRGKPSLPPNSYGVYADPLAKTLTMAGIPAISIAGWTIEDLKTAVADGHPVVCWVVGNTAPGKRVVYRSEAGNEVFVAEQMNTVTVDGFNDRGFSVWDNGENYFRTFKDFDTSWKILGYQALRILNAPAAEVEAKATVVPLAPYLETEQAGTALLPYPNEKPDEPSWNAPTPAGGENAWWNEGADSYWRTSKKDLENTGKLPGTSFWNDETIELFGQLPEVHPTYSPDFNVNEYQTWLWNEPVPSVPNANLPSPDVYSDWGGAPFGRFDLDTGGFAPPAAAIDGFVGYPQSYNLDCETRSAIDLAAFFGTHIDHMTFLTALPKSDDPNEGFVGNYWDPRGGLPPQGYGVYEQPVAGLLTAFGFPVFGVSNFTWDQLKAQIGVGNPVMVWVVGSTEGGAPVSYTPSNGRATTVARFQHTVIVVGYDENAGTVTLQDGGQRYTRTIQTFLTSWGILGNRALFRAN